MTDIAINVPADEDKRFLFHIEEVRKVVSTLSPEGCCPWEIVIRSDGRDVHCRPVVIAETAPK